MKRVGFALAVFLLSAACSSATSTPASNSAAPPQQQPDTVPPDAVGGACTQITPTVGVCQTIDTCPGIQVDQTAFPQCGFEIHGAALDLECLCAGSLCPVGITTSCADVQNLLANTTVAQVCERAVTHHCLNLGALGTQTCQACRQNCNGNPTCQQGCGQC